MARRKWIVMLASLVLVGGSSVARADGGTTDTSTAHFPGQGAADPLALDNSWDFDGRVVTDAARGKIDDSGWSVRAYPDGRVVVAGIEKAQDGSVDLVVLRYLEDGAIDRSFGHEGVVELQETPHYLEPDVRVLPDGRVLVTTWYSLIMLTRSGALDNEFGDHGFVAHDQLSEHTGAGVQVDSQGRIVVGGTLHEHDGQDHSWRIRRYRPDGSPDPNFGTNGVLDDTRSGLVGSGERLWAIAIGANDRVYASGYSDAGDGHATGEIRAYDDAGPATDFGNQGVEMLPGMWLTNIVAQPARLFVATGDGYCVVGIEQSETNCTTTGIAPLASYNDGSFAVHGDRVVVLPSQQTQTTMRVTTFVGTTDTTASIAFADNATPNGLAFDLQGRILVVGSTVRGSDTDTAVARLLGDYQSPVNQCTHDCGASATGSQDTSATVEGVLAVGLQNSSVVFGLLESGAQSAETAVGDITYWNTLAGSDYWSATVVASDLTGPNSTIPYSALSLTPGRDIEDVAPGSAGLPVYGPIDSFHGLFGNDNSDPLTLLTAQPGDRGKWTQHGTTLRLQVPVAASAGEYHGVLQYTITN